MSPEQTTSHTEQRRPPVPDWQRASIGKLIFGGFVAVAAAATIGALFQRLTHSTADAGVPLFAAWLVVFILIVPAAYRRGVRDAKMHPDDPTDHPLR